MCQFTSLLTEHFDFFVNTLPDINSPFNIDTYTDCSSRYPDQTLANDLLHDILSRVKIGLSGNRDGQICENHF